MFEVPQDLCPQVLFEQTSRIGVLARRGDAAATATAAAAAAAAATTW